MDDRRISDEFTREDSCIFENSGIWHELSIREKRRRNDRKKESDKRKERYFFLFLRICIRVSERHVFLFWLFAYLHRLSYSFFSVEKYILHISIYIVCMYIYDTTLNFSMDFSRPIIHEKLSENCQ